uniref:Uncharacterized protein n=1 Tax=Rhizophora mucronata TaxID=61149 RepID=A0A2P2PMU0_RHIMU
MYTLFIHLCICLFVFATVVC